MFRLDPLFLVQCVNDLPSSLTSPSAARTVDTLWGPPAQIAAIALQVGVTTAGPGGWHGDVRLSSPGRGMVVFDATTLILPEFDPVRHWRTLRNLLSHPRICLFVAPPDGGCAMHIAGSAAVSRQPELLGGLIEGGVMPRFAIVIHVQNIALHGDVATLPALDASAPMFWRHAIDIAGVARDRAWAEGNGCINQSSERGSCDVSS